MRGSVSPAWLLVGLLPLLVAGITLDPARIDEGNFGPTWAQYARERDTAPPALALYAAFALSAPATAAWVWRALGTRGARIAATALAAAVAGSSLYLLAGSWTPTTDVVEIEGAARTIEQVRTTTLILALILALTSLIGVGVAIQRRSPLPRWLYGLPIMSGALLLLVPVGFATIGAATFFVPSAVLLMLWLVIISANAAAPRRATVGGG